MINEDLEIKHIKRKYNAILEKYIKKNPYAIKCYLALKRINRVNITSMTREKSVEDANRDVGTNLKFEELNDYLKENSKEVESILKEFAKAIKDYTILSKKTISHVTKHNKNELNGVLCPSKNATIYNESEGEFVFGSADEINKKMYALRMSTGGMVRLYDRMFIFPSNHNIDLSSGKFILKNRIYSYNFPVEDFEPVVSLFMSKGKPLVRFDDEWISCNPQIINDYRLIRDVSEILDLNKIFVWASNMVEANSKISFELAHLKNYRSMSDKLKGLCQSGAVEFLNPKIKEIKSQLNIDN